MDCCMYVVTSLIPCAIEEAGPIHNEEKQTFHFIPHSSRVCACNCKTQTNRIVLNLIPQASGSDSMTLRDHDEGFSYPDPVWPCAWNFPSVPTTIENLGIRWKLPSIMPSALAIELLGFCLLGSIYIFFFTARRGRRLPPGKHSLAVCPGQFILVL